MRQPSSAHEGKSMIVGMIAVVIFGMWWFGYFAPVADPIALSLAPPDAEPGSLGYDGEATLISKLIQGALFLIGETVLFFGRHLWSIIRYLFDYVLRSFAGIGSLNAGGGFWNVGVADADGVQSGAVSVDGTAKSTVGKAKKAQSPEERLAQAEKTISQLIHYVNKHEKTYKSLDSATSFAEFKRLKGKKTK